MCVVCRGGSGGGVCVRVVGVGCRVVACVQDVGVVEMMMHRHHASVVCVRFFIPTSVSG